jgi:hypothetical protein
VHEAQTDNVKDRVYQKAFTRWLKAHPPGELDRLVGAPSDDLGLVIEVGKSQDRGALSKVVVKR